VKKIAIVPAYNESENIVKTVNEIQERARGFDYIIINDCSTDDTKHICEENDFNIINLPINLGIGGAVQTGYKYAQENGYDIAVQVDGDGQHSPEYLEAMLVDLITHDADMVIGSRYITFEGFQSTVMRRVGATYFTWLIKLLTGVTITDSTSGLRMVNGDAIALFSKYYPRDYPEPESIVSLLRQKKKVREIPVMMNAREWGESSISISRSVYYMIKVSLAIIVERLR